MSRNEMYDMDIDEILDFQLEREKEEQAIIDKYVEEHPEVINPDYVAPGFEDFDKESAIDLTKDELTPEDMLKMEEDDPLGDDKLPQVWDIRERIKFMYDDYLGRIPFSDKMPKNIYNEIYAAEITRKLIVDRTNIKLNYKGWVKNRAEAIKFITDKYDFTQYPEVELEPIIKKLKILGFHTPDLSKFKDVKDGKFTPDRDYEITPVMKDFELDDVPADIPQKDKADLKKLHDAMYEYKDLKAQGYVSNDGMFMLNDMRPIKEDDHALKIRNLFWTTEHSIEMYAGKMRVLKRQAESIADYNKRCPTKVEDEYPKPNTIEYKEEPHPHDPNYVVIDGRIAHANKDPKSPYYPQWKQDSEHTIDEVWKMEEEYANEFLELEETIKDLKRQFKDRREWYFSNGVQVKSVDRVIRQLKRTQKRTPQELRTEDEIFNRLSNNSGILTRIRASM